MFKVPSLKSINASLQIPGDKSISHRAIILSSVVEGSTRIFNFLNSQDTLVTLEAFKKLGVDIRYNRKNKEAVIKGGGKYFKSEDKILQMKESGTSIRLISGVLSAQNFKTTLSAYPSLQKRPMKRITHPLRMMGADIKGKVKGKEEYPPLKISPVKKLKAIEYKLPIASAQVKSCLLLAGLYAEGETILIEPYKSRDHTERMLKFFGTGIEVRGRKISIKNPKLKSPKEIFIPSDFSSAAYFIALASLSKKSNLLIRAVEINPTRTGFLNVLKRMGAKIKFKNANKNYFEPYADILVESSCLKATQIFEEEIPLLIDEVPLLFILASFAKGRTKIFGLKELKVKETDRINSLEYNLKRMGVKIVIKDYINSKGKKDISVEIVGPAKFKDAPIKSFSDHRTAMSLIIGNLALGKSLVIDEVECISKSFPQFLEILDFIRDFRER